MERPESRRKELNSATGVSVASHNGALHLFCVLDDGSIWPLGYTTDRGSWTTSGARPPVGLTTWQPIATVEFGHCLLHLCPRWRDIRPALHVELGSADVVPWEDVPAVGLRPGLSVIAAVLGDRLFLFEIYDTGKPPESKVVVVTSTDDTLVWTPWTVVLSLLFTALDRADRRQRYRPTTALRGLQSDRTLTEARHHVAAARNRCSSTDLARGRYAAKRRDIGRTGRHRRAPSVALSTRGARESSDGEHRSL
jgi:hypothetical protein